MTTKKINAVVNNLQFTLIPVEGSFIKLKDDQNNIEITILAPANYALANTIANTIMKRLNHPDVNLNLEFL